MNSLDIDELVEFINNKGTRKEDLQKAPGSSKKAASNAKGASSTNQGQTYEGSTLETQPEEMDEDIADALGDATNRQKAGSQSAR